jgi:hypothetical protein
MKKRFLGTKSNTDWFIYGLVGAGLYFILLDKATGIQPVDTLLEGVGDITGIEGRGKGFLPDLLPGNMSDDNEPPIDEGKVADDAGMGLSFGNAYVAERLTIS